MYRSVKFKVIIDQRIWLYPTLVLNSVIIGLSRVITVLPTSKDKTEVPKYNNILLILNNNSVYTKDTMIVKKSTTEFYKSNFVVVGSHIK